MCELIQSVRELKLQDGVNNTVVSYLKVYRFSNTIIYLSLIHI